MGTNTEESIQLPLVTESGHHVGSGQPGTLAAVGRLCVRRGLATSSPGR